jgi:uncharacterized FlaG/YvyC family protein
MRERGGEAMSNDRVMVVGATQAAQAPFAGPRPAVAAKQDKEQTDVSQERRAEPSAESVKAVAQRIETYLKTVNRALEFRVDEPSGRTVVTVRDSVTGEVIRQIPNEDVLRFAEMAEDQTIVLVSEKV